MMLTINIIITVLWYRFRRFRPDVRMHIIINHYCLSFLLLNYLISHLINQNITSTNPVWQQGSFSIFNSFNYHLFNCFIVLLFNCLID